MNDVTHKDSYGNVIVTNDNINGNNNDMIISAYNWLELC